MRLLYFVCMGPNMFASRAIMRIAREAHTR